MFSIGDKIFYPMLGAGTIMSIEEKEFLGVKQIYYIMDIPHKNMQVMIPKGKDSNINIRKIVNLDVIENVLESLKIDDTDFSINYIQRSRINMSKIKSGDIYESAEVIRDLVRINKIKGLGTEDRHILNNAQQILISELALVKNIAQEEAESLLNEAINY